MSYVDLHCHLLPGLDDGATTMERTISQPNPAIQGGGGMFGDMTKRQCWSMRADHVCGLYGLA